MKEKILTIINDIRLSKDLPVLESISEESSLRDDLGLTSFDLAELTVNIAGQHADDSAADACFGRNAGAYE